MPGLEHRVKKEAWGRAFVYAAYMGNGRQNPSTERQMKNRIRTVFGVCRDRACRRSGGFLQCVCRTALHFVL